MQLHFLAEILGISIVARYIDQEPSHLPLTLASHRYVNAKVSINPSIRLPNAAGERLPWQPQATIRPWRINPKWTQLECKRDP